MTSDSQLRVFFEPAADVEIAGSTAALRHLAVLLRTATDNATSTPVDSAGSEAVHSISVRHAGTMVRISESSGILFIEGTKEKLDILADNMEYLASSESEHAHVHVDHYDGHPYLDAESLPLIVSRNDPTRGDPGRSDRR